MIREHKPTAREYKPTVGALASRWAIVRMETSVPLCVWRLCEQKAAASNVEHSNGERPITPFKILAWEGLWALGTEVSRIRPVEGCACVLCEARRKDGAR